jgi:hypothetical protein
MFPGMETTTSLVPASEPATKPVLLKADVRGRVKRTAEQRDKLLDEFERSGVSGAHFAALVGVKYQTFATWVQARKRGRPTYPKRKHRSAKPNPVQWIEAVVPHHASSSDAGLLMHLPGGARVEVANSQQLALAAALLRALEKPC